MSAKATKPSRLYYLLAAVLLGIGVAAVFWPFVSLFSKAFAHLTETPCQIVVPGQQQFVLDEPGNYTICYEYQTVLEGEIFNTPRELPGLQARLVSVETGEEVPLSPGMSYSYTIGRRAGEGVWDFEIERPGAYELSASYPEGVEGPEQLVLVVQESFAFRGMASRMLLVVAGILLGLICVGAAIAVFVITLIKRVSRAGGRSQAFSAPSAGRAGDPTGPPMR